MGYYTSYELNVLGEVISPELELRLKRMDEFDYSPLWGFITRENEECTWYQHEEDITKISIDFPNVVFKLDGHGENKMDYWRKYFKGGRMMESVARISFAPYDESKLE